MKKQVPLLVSAVTVLCLIVLPLQGQAKTKPAQAAQPIKERLVLMPLRLGEEDKSRQAAMEIALLEGLQLKYEVFSGEQVAKKAREIFLKESRNTAHKECDETRCLQGIAEAFQAELLAVASVSKQEDGYFLALSVQNIFDNKVVYSKSMPRKNCDAYQVVDKLKGLSGVSDIVATTQVVEEPQIKIKLNNPEGALWDEVQKGNTTDDYAAYLTQYPKGKYIALAKSRIKKLQELAESDLAEKDKNAWSRANSTATEMGYQEYLRLYPQGQYAGLVHARIRKLQTEMVPGRVFKDCEVCPEMIILPAGSFNMGGKLAAPIHRVTVDKIFSMGRTEVTQGQWKAIMGNNPSKFTSCGDNCPVELVSWDDAKAFIQKLNAKTGKQYRLPSEAEWEYACRAGGTSEYCGSDSVGSVGWYSDNSESTTHVVAQKQANAFGLYDMSGNVWEWVEDSYHSDYVGAPSDGSAWYGEMYGAELRLLRGGSWLDYSDALRSGSRKIGGADSKDYYFGFRIARTFP